MIHERDLKNKADNKWMKRNKYFVSLSIIDNAIETR